MMERTLLDDWSRHCQEYFADTISHIHPIHPCIINGRAHYVHAPHLAEKDPTYFSHLQQFALEQGIGLKADQRASGTDSHSCRRKKFIPIIFLAMSFMAPCLLAEQVDQQLGLMVANPGVIEDYGMGTNTSTGLVGKLERSLMSEALEKILLAHLDNTPGQPLGMQRDIEELALYYARYPEVINLLKSIAGAEWRLRYAPHTFQTHVSGSRLEVEQIDVFFDPRSAARLKFYDKCKTQKPFCIASPADALLHELLHVQTITRDTNHFIRQGGLDPMRYPTEHERFTIQKENQLYASMTAVDGHARPIRSEHNGRHVLVSCATCLE